MGNQHCKIRIASQFARKEIQFTSFGSHTVRWVYVNDVSDSDGEECVWFSALAGCQRQ